MTAPRISHDTVTSILSANGCNLRHACWLAIRGYYLDSMGKAGKNDRGLWDDAWALYSPQHGVITYRANTDPTGFRAGSGTGANKGRAVLSPGVWIYGAGPHKGRRAFRQCRDVVVMRDKIGGGSYPHKGMHAINIHDAPGNSTSSEGCQTAPRPQFQLIQPMFVQWLEEAKNPWDQNDWKQKCRAFEYVLIEETERRKGNLLAPLRHESRM